MTPAFPLPSRTRMALDRVGLVVVVTLIAAGTPHAASTSDLAEARRLYNQGRYDAAIEAARVVSVDAALRHPALVILARASLERFRQAANTEDLEAAREALRAVDASRLDPRDRVELVVGLGEALYLDDLFGPAADLLESAIGEAVILGPAARDQLLDWWATALDRQAQSRPPAERGAIYDRVLARMTTELERDAATSAAIYWLTAATRAKGDLDRAWDLARAGWVRAQLTRDRGASVRQDLDRLVREAIVPERARRLQGAGGVQELATSGMLTEWEAFTGKWGR